MKIGFDYRPAQKKNSRRRGIGKYTEQLLQSLLERGERAGHQFLVYHIGEKPAGLGGEWKRTPYLSKPSRANWMLDLLWLPGALRRDGVEVFHAGELTSIPLSRTSAVWAHVHDLIPFLFYQEMKDDFPPDYRLALKIARRRLALADKLLTPSRHSKEDICRHLAVGAEKVEVLYPGLGPHIRPLPRSQARDFLQRSYGLEEPFIFYVGGTDYRKNLLRLLEVFARLRDRGYPGRLVLAGEAFLWELPGLRKCRRLIQATGLQGRVLFPGYIPDQDLAAFYGAADLFFFPSLYEGFGLPVLEALACGAPVVTSRIASLPEVGGDAVVYIDPHSVEGMAEEIWSLLQDQERRTELSRRGPLQAQSFRWERSVTRLLRLYEAMEEKGRRPAGKGGHEGRD